MSKKEFLDFVIKYRKAEAFQRVEHTVEVLGLGKVSVYFDNANKKNRFHLIDQDRSVILADLK